VRLCTVPAHHGTESQNKNMAKLIGLVAVLLIAAGFSWHIAGRAPGPKIGFLQPTGLIGQTGELHLNVDAPGAKLNRLDVVLEQGGGKSTRLFDLANPSDVHLVRDGNRVEIGRSIGKRSLPQLEAGKARITVTASRPVLFGLREAVSTASREIDVNLSPPTLTVESKFHFINLGGSEMVVYRVSPANATSGVRVADQEYPGFPASGARVSPADPGLRVAFFALLWNQDRNTPIELFAHDEVGNESRASFDYRVFPKKFRESRIALDDRFLGQVVPAILSRSTDSKVADPGDVLGSFLRINNDLRHDNNETIRALARSSEPKILWDGPFRQLVNTAVEGGFADQRTYAYQGRVVDHQVHLGFDLASVTNAPVQAANSGRVAYAAWLGIYGNCVIVDHGMGVQSLYAHLSNIVVKPGSPVSTGQVLGYTGSTGLAGGDHLHFTMLLGGNPVTPIDWWSGKWVQDRILRKLQDASQERLAMLRTWD
jgi:murein DD-endopeptidase MepM/ murein hydrolase activator NlpD